MKNLMLLICIPVFLLSCPDGGNEPETKTFWAHNFTNNNFYQLDAELLAEGTYCNVWVEKGSGVNEGTAKKVADEYDNKIHPKMIAAFGVKIDMGEYGLLDPMELADAYTDGDGKLCVLLLDIKDGYNPGVNESAVGGYFLPNDLFEGPNSNFCDMIYIDTYPGKPGEAASNNTLAHEMQHLMNEITSQELRARGNTYYQMDLWIDEGLSGAAEWVYSGVHPDYRWKWYSDNGAGANAKGLIDKGNNFYVWGNRTNESRYAEQDDYATAYLFFQWLRIQSSKGTGIYKDIIGSANENYKAVTSAASSISGGSSYASDNWANLLGDWLAANHINNASGAYGYKNDSTLKNIKKHYIPGSDTSANLYPGEGVFSKINSTVTTSTATNIKYIFISNSSISNSTNIADGTLLTYNESTVNSGTPTTSSGTVTGIASISVDFPVNGRFVAPGLSGPFWVSGGDVLRRNGRAGNLSPAGFPRSLIRISK